MKKIEEIKNSLLIESDPKQFSIKTNELGNIYLNNNDNSIAKFFLNLLGKSKTQKFKIHCLQNLQKLNFIEEKSENLIPLLKKKNSEIVIQTLKTLSSFNDFKKEELLIELLNKTKDNNIKSQIIKNLCKLGSRNSIDLIISLFKKSRDLNIRFTAYTALQILNKKHLDSDLEAFLNKNYKKWYRNFKIIQYGELKSSIYLFLEDLDPNTILFEFPLEEQFIGFVQIYVKELNNKSWWSIKYGIQNSQLDYFNAYINQYPHFTKHLKFEGLDFDKNLNESYEHISDFFENEFRKFCEIWKKPTIELVKKMANDLPLSDFEKDSLMLGFLKTEIGEQSEYLNYTFEIAKNNRNLFDSLNYINAKKTKANN